MKMQYEKLLELIKSFVTKKRISLVELSAVEKSGVEVRDGFGNIEIRYCRYLPTEFHNNKVIYSRPESFLLFVSMSCDLTWSIETSD